MELARGAQLVLECQKAIAVDGIVAAGGFGRGAAQRQQRGLGPVRSHLDDVERLLVKLAAQLGDRVRTAAEPLVGAEIWLLRADLPAPADGEYYWCDLVGLEVRTAADEALGAVRELFETGSGAAPAWASAA